MKLLPQSVHSRHKCEVIALSVLSLLLIVGCGHNRFNEYRSTGLTAVIPFGDMGSLGIGIGSTEYTTAMIRGGSSFSTETAAGAGLLSGAAGSSRITTFKSNTQLNEGNLVKALTESNISEEVKVELAKGLAKEMRAPDIQSSVLQTREAVIYSNGVTNEFVYPFKPTGVDKVVGDVTDTVKTVVEDIADATENVVNNVTDSVDNSIDSVVESTHNLTKAQAWAALGFAILAGIIMFLKFFNTKPETGCPPPSRTDEIQPPQIDPDDTGDDPTPDDTDPPDNSDTPSAPEKTEDKRSKFERGIDAAMEVLNLFNKLPKKQKQVLMDSARVVSTPSPKK